MCKTRRYPLDRVMHMESNDRYWKFDMNNPTISSNRVLAF
jgi:hypothetical protein